MEFFYNTIRGFFFQLDGVVYGLIDDVYELLLTISRTSIFTNDVISEFSERIFAIAGIFMLFKVTLSLINYVINPDDFTDKNKGFSKIGIRIVTSLALLVLVPYIFREAYTLQAIILEENTLMHLVFGNSQKRLLPMDNYVEEAGSDIQFTLMSSFLQPNVSEFYTDSTYNLSECVEIYDRSDNGLIKTRSDSKFIDALNPACFGEYDATNDIYECTTPLCQAFRNDTSSSADDSGSEDLFQTYAQAIAQKNYSLLMRKDLILVSVNDKYVIDYKMFFSTAIGVVVIYLFLLFCIDIAVRSVKLGFLEMIAPVPILSYIDPKSSDKGMFKKWFEYCWKTYLSLFLRLFALYLGIYAITIMGGYTDFVTGEVIEGNWLLNVFMIVGILIFVKQLPKILDDALGLKISDGKFHLNPFKKLEEEALGYKQLRGIGAAGAAGAAAFGTNLLFSRGKGGIFNPRHWGSALAGGFSAAGRGLVGAAKGEKFGKNFSNSYGAAMQAKMSRNDRIDDGVSWAAMQTSKIKQAVGGHTKGEAVKSAQDAATKIQDAYKAMQNAAVGNDKGPFSSGSYNYTDKAGRYHDFTKYGDFDGIKGLEKYLDEIKKTAINRGDFASDAAGEAAYLQAVRDQQTTISDLEDIKDIRLNRLASGAEHTQDKFTDRAITEAYETMQGLVKDLNSATRAFDPGIGTIDATLSAKDINGATKGVSSQIAGSTAANRATRVDQYAQRKGQK